MHLAYQFAKRGQKATYHCSHLQLLITHFKNAQHSQYQHIIKVGKSNQKEGLNYDGSTAVEYPDFRNTAYDNNSRGIIVVGATCYSPHTRKLEFMD